MDDIQIVVIQILILSIDRKLMYVTFHHTVNANEHTHPITVLPIVFFFHKLLSQSTYHVSHS